MKAPTIIIGVGGVGSQICAKVEEQLLHTVSQSTGPAHGQHPLCRA